MQNRLSDSEIKTLSQLLQPFGITVKKSDISLQEAKSIEQSIKDLKGSSSFPASIALQSIECLEETLKWLRQQLEK